MFVALSWLFLSTAGAAEPPCYGFAHPNRLDSDHFWVEWPNDAFDATRAQVVLDAAEHARDVYTNDLGWPFTDESVVIAVLADSGDGISGLTQTIDCDGVPVPHIELTVGGWTDDRARSVTAHEMGHAVQYGYMGAYLDSVASWLWWMEGSAEWIEGFATEDEDAWGRAASGYLASPWMALHQGPTAYLVPEQSDHMYGTCYLARFIEQEYGAEAVRDTWEWAAPQSGTALFFPDAIEGIGLDFDPLWERFLAGMTVGDIQGGDHLGRRVAAIDVAALPAEGEPATGFFPEGMGITAVHFEAATGRSERALQITFDGKSDIDWIVVLVRTDGFRIGGTVIDYVPLDVEDGAATGWLSGFDGSVDAWLLASPITRDVGPHRLSWEASLIEDPGPMEGVVPFHVDDEEDPKGCACDTPGIRHPWPFAAVALLLVRRRVRG